jgi:tellurite resistance protein TerC
VATSIWFWIIFNIFVLAMLAVDLGIFHRDDHAVTMREASIWTVVWISLALIFNLGIYLFVGPTEGLQFLTGYLIEKSLSVDNIFVFVLLFTYFQVPAIYQHRVLFWGIIGALLMRGALIGVGAFLISQFHWVIYIFGAFLVFTGIRMALQKDEHVDVESNAVVKLLRRIMPVTQNYHGHDFFTRQGGKLFATPLFVVLLIVETTDLIFALDSIPAIFAITTDPFIVYTSNVFAILGLRSLYFLLAGVISKFRFLKVGLSAILVFVGIKMLIEGFYHIPILVSLGVIAAVLTISIVASLLFPETAETEVEVPTEIPPSAQPPAMPS